MQLLPAICCIQYTGCVTAHRKPQPLLQHVSVRELAAGHLGRPSDTNGSFADRSRTPPPTWNTCDAVKEQIDRDSQDIDIMKEDLSEIKQMLTALLEDQEERG